jgi:group I intron endonuclease
MVYNLIYKTTNLVNGKIYVGKHAQNGLEFDGYFGSGIWLVRSVRKYGKENFIREIVEIVCPKLTNINEREKFWIDKLDARNSLIGYNISKGGDGWDSETLTNKWKDDEWREKQLLLISEANNRPEVKSKRNASLKRISNTPEQKEIHSRLSKERWNDPEWKERQIKIQTEANNRPEVKSKRNASLKISQNRQEFKEKISKYKRKFHYILKCQNGNIYETDCLLEFCKSNNLDNSSMANLVNEKRKSYKGWTCLSKSLKK